jgi:hypothetical protein
MRLIALAMPKKEKKFDTYWAVQGYSEGVQCTNFKVNQVQALIFLVSAET